jgi:hypothetical protein
MRSVACHKYHEASIRLASAGKAVAGQPDCMENRGLDTPLNDQITRSPSYRSLTNVELYRLKY